MLPASVAGHVSIETNPDLASVITAAINAKLGPIDGTTFEVVAGGARGREKNTQIAEVNKGKRPFPAGRRTKRDPYYLDERAMETLRFAARGLLGSAATATRSLKNMADLVLLAVKRNVERQRNPDGSAFTDLTDDYAAMKARRFGFVIPILRASGDLMDNLLVRVTRRGFGAGNGEG